MTPEAQTRREMLLSLAAKVEAASGADTWLDGQIAEALSEWRNIGGYYVEHKVTGERKRTTYPPAPAYTASLDSAMTLVPEGWSFQVSANPASSYATVVDPAMEDELDTERVHSSNGRTPALALTAAALKALAQDTPHAE